MSKVATGAQQPLSESRKTLAELRKFREAEAQVSKMSLQEQNAFAKSAMKTKSPKKPG